MGPIDLQFGTFPSKQILRAMIINKLVNMQYCTVLMCHLIRCLRNAMIEEDIQHSDGTARWSDIVLLYEKDGLSVDSKITKLSELHVRRQGKMKMKVSVATQVFSNKVYATMLVIERFGGATRRSQLLLLNLSIACLTV